MEKDDVELVQSILSGDEAAFSILVRKYQKSVHALAWRKIGDFHIAEEITQDTFLHVYKKLTTLKNPKQFAGWLYVIADRRCIAWLRKKKLDMQLMEAISEETLEKTAYASYVTKQREKAAVEHQRKIVQKLLEKLPESERTVMVLHYLGEMSCEAISKFLGVSPNTIKSRLQRGRERLRNEESIIRETLGSVRLPANLTENIMQQIDKVKQMSPSGSKGSKPLPWVALASSAVLVFLLIGASNQYIVNFQQPYSIDAQSETAIEIVDASVVLDIVSKPELQNRVEHNVIVGKSNDNGLSNGKTPMKNNLAQDPMQWNLPEDAKARLGKGRISEIQYSPDGTILAVASGVGIWLYDATTHQEVALLTDHTGLVNRLAFSPDGHTFASGDRNGTIILWDRSTGAQKTLIGHTNSDTTIVFSPDGKIIASGDGDTVQLWNTITGEHKDSLTGLPESIGYISFSPDGNTIVSVTGGSEICISDAITGKHKKTSLMSRVSAFDEFCYKINTDSF